MGRLFGRDELTIETVFLLDQIQKKLPLEKAHYLTLRKAGLIEGKIPNVFVSAKIAVIVSDALDERQKENKVRYFLTSLHRKGAIERTSANRRTGVWQLAKPKKE